MLRLSGFISVAIAQQHYSVGLGGGGGALSPRVSQMSLRPEGHN